MLNPIRTLRQGRQEAVLWATPRKVGALDTGSTSFPSQGAVESWGFKKIFFLPACSELNHGKGLRILLVQNNIFSSLVPVSLNILGIINALSQARQNPILYAASRKVGALDTWFIFFPLQGEVGMWSFSSAYSLLSLWEGLWKLNSICHLCSL